MNKTFLTTLTVETLRKELENGLQNIEVPCPEMIMVKSVTEYGVHARSIFEPMQNWLSGQRSKIEKNGNEIIKKMYGHVKIDEAGEERICALIEEVDKLLKDEEMQMEFRYNQAEVAKSEFTDTRNTFLNKKIEANAYEKYRKLMGVYFESNLRVFMYEHMRAILVNLKAMLSY